MSHRSLNILSAHWRDHHLLMTAHRVRAVIHRGTGFSSGINMSYLSPSIQFHSFTQCVSPYTEQA